MLSFFRSFLNSKVGIGFALAFLAIIAVGFAAGDITGTGGGLHLFSGNSDRVAKVGGASLSDSELQSRVQRVYEQTRRENPGLLMSTFEAQGGVEQIMNQLIAGLSITEYAGQQGMAISKRLIDAEIANIPAFQDASGKFNQDQFRQLLARERISEQALRDDIRRDLQGRQLLAPASFGSKLPDSLVLPYASLLLEARQGRIAAIPAALFAPAGAPDEKALAAFYAQNSDRFTVPEQRRLRYALIDKERFAKTAEPTDAEVGKYYADHKTDYAARENRSFEQLILPTESAAKTIADQVKGGKTLTAAAQAAGLAAANLTNLSQAALSAQSSDAIAKAAFGATKGAVLGPIKASLGWYVLRVTDIARTPEKTLADVRAQIADVLRAQKVQHALSDFTSKIEDQIGNGATFDEVVKDNGLTVTATPFILQTGQSAQQADYKPTPEVQALLKPSFEMDQDDDAQIVPIVPDQRFALLDVTDVTAAAPLPLAKVHDQLVQLYKLHQGDVKAKALADQIKAKTDKGMDFEKALAEAGVKLPPVQKIGARRADITRGGQRVPPALALLFSMPQGTVKSLEAGQEQGYLLVKLDQIQRADAARQPMVVEATRQQLSQVVGNEYADQFERAIEKQLGVTRNPAALQKVKQDLRSANGGAQ